jgi:hypothetical protein
VVWKIVELGAEIRPEPFADRESLLERGVPVVHVRSENRVGSKVAISAGCGYAKRGRVEELRAADARAWIAYQIRTLGTGAGAGDVGRKRHVERQSGLNGRQLSMPQISSIERCANLAGIESLLAICRAFDTKPSEILASIEF